VTETLKDGIEKKINKKTLQNKKKQLKDLGLILT
jgi:hypothetical protein